MSPAAAMPTARPMMPSSERLVSNKRSLPKRSCKPSVTAWTPPLRPTSSPKTSIRGLIASSCSSVRRTAVTRLMRGPCGSARSVAAGGTMPALLLQVGRAVAQCLGKHVPFNALRVRLHAAFDFRKRFGDSRASLAHFEIPIGGREDARHQLGAKMSQRIPGDFCGDFIRAFIGLRVLTRMGGPSGDHEPQQCGAIAGTHARDRVLNQGGHPHGIGSVTLEHAQTAKAFEITGDIAARRLVLRSHRNAVAVIFDK